MLRKFISISIFIFTFMLAANAYANRFYIPPFTPESVTVADGFLQIKLPKDIANDTCANKRVIVLADSHKYFDSYLSLAMTALVSDKKLIAALGGSCVSSNGWFQISGVLALTK